MVQFRDIEQETSMRRDLTRTEADLTRTEARLAAFLRNMAEGILVLDDDSRITYASEAASQLLKVPVASLVANASRSSAGRGSHGRACGAPCN